jgi:hypothetical protein
MNRLWSAVSLLEFVAAGLIAAPSCATAQGVVGWPAGSPAAIVQGPTLNATLRNALQATSDQVRVVTRTATDVGRRAKGAFYQSQDLANDYQNLQFHFQNLRATFNVAGELALQLQSARAANATAELTAGLDIISEAFAPVQKELQTGAANRDTVVSMCQVLNLALNEWQKELKKNSVRLGMIR